MKTEIKEKDYVVSLNSNMSGLGHLSNGWSMHIRKGEPGLEVEWGMLYMKQPIWKEYHVTYVNGLEELKALCKVVSGYEYWGRYCRYCDPKSTMGFSHPGCVEGHGEKDRRWVDYEGWQYRIQRYNKETGEWVKEWK